MRRIILASRSKSRKFLLRQAAVRFRSVAPRTLEAGRRTGSCEEFVVDNALRKARDVARRVKGGIVVAADTVVAAGGRIIAKPRTARGAFRMLRSLSGRAQWVCTGLAVIDTDRGRSFTAFEKTKVVMRRMSAAQIRQYVERARPFDKSGGFDVTGRGAVFVERVEGCFYNVLGMPLARLAVLLKKAGATIDE